VLVVDWLGQARGCAAQVGEGQVTTVRSGMIGLVIHFEFDASLCVVDGMSTLPECSVCPIF
jgi:hypothetical protein